MSQAGIKQILVMASQDYPEAMRVAAGLTIFGHEVSLVFINGVIEETPETLAQAELLELCEIEPYSLVEDPNVERIDSNGLTGLISKSHHIVNI